MKDLEQSIVDDNLKNARTPDYGESMYALVGVTVPGLGDYFDSRIFIATSKLPLDAMDNVTAKILRECFRKSVKMGVGTFYSMLDDSHMDGKNIAALAEDAMFMNEGINPAYMLSEKPVALNALYEVIGAARESFADVGLFCEEVGSHDEFKQAEKMMVSEVLSLSVLLYMSTEQNT